MGGLCHPKKVHKQHQSHPPVEKTEHNLRLNKFERQYLTLIYTDLANRSQNKMLNQHNFSLFFQLTGLWGDKLFQFFTQNNQSQIDLSHFLYAMSEIVRSSFDQKLYLLFNFIKNEKDRGIKYKQFLKMLYHYSKPQLKEIMTNDGVFVHQAIIPSSKQLQKEKQSEIIHLQHNPNQQIKQNSVFNEAFQKISKEYRDPGTLIQFKTQKLTYQVSYCNMSALTKSYASHIFMKYGIDEENGSMNEQQFKQYVGGNQKLYQTYYSVFHEELWGYINEPMFYKHIEKQSNIILTQGINSREGHMMLVSDTLFFSTNDRKQEVFRIIILEGVVVNEQEERKMMIKEQLEGNPIALIQFPSTEIRNNWLEQLKIYNNNYFQNKYEVMQKIGTGKFSVVFRCRERATQKQYALKRLQLDKLSQKQLALIQNQTEIAKILNSPHFAKLHQTIFTKKTIYIVSQYIFGEDLFQFVRKRKRLKQSEAAFLLGQIIQAVLHLHSMEIVHRDLKPQNIMVSYKKNEKISDELTSPLKISRPKPEKIKIIDFGFANYLSKLQYMGQQTAGTPGYIAPQTLLGEKPSFLNDIFSIGCILYYMLRGKYPFVSINSMEIALSAIKGDYSLSDGVWDQISEQAKDLVSKLMESDPNQRISLKNALNHPWFISLNGYNNNQP